VIKRLLDTHCLSKRCGMVFNHTKLSFSLVNKLRKISLHQVRISFKFDMLVAKTFKKKRVTYKLGN